MSINSATVDEKKTNVSKKDTFLRLMKYLGKYRIKMALVITIMILASVITVELPSLIEHAIDVDIANKDKVGLIKTVSICVSLSLIWSIFLYVRVRIMAKISNSVVQDIRSEAFAHLQTLGLYYFDSRPTGKILSRLIGDITALKDMLKQMVISIIPNVCFFIIITIVMIAKNPVFSLSAFIALPILAFGTVTMMHKAYKFWQDFRQKESNVNAYSHETFSGIRVVQSYQSEGQMKEEFDKINKEGRACFIGAVKRSDSIGAIIDISQGIGYLFLYFFAIKVLKINATNVGSLIAYATYLGLFWQPIRQMANVYNQFGNQIAGAERVFEILDTPPTLVESTEAIELKDVKGEVEFKNVSFAYPDDLETKVLENVSFKVKGGQTIALVGPTGAGKTTIVNLICRFYDCISGKIFIDGKDISEISFSSLRKNVTVMTQDSYLFSGTIKDNLIYGAPDVTDEQIQNACKLLGAEDFILKSEKGYDTEISGTSLSQGEKQLLALARTLLCNPSILILDEATSAIDTHTELLVQRGIKILTQGRTSFVVAHRLSTIKNADCIMVIDHKGIQEAGTHQELLKKNGQYAALYNAQFASLNSK